jgi:threonine dehydratase
VSTLDRAGIGAAHALIRPHVRETPVLMVNGGDLALADAPLTLKLELFQHSGSFKVRGAFLNLLARKIPPAGVVAASGGNHGAAVAFAARRLGVPARIYVPTVASPAKVAQIRAYGADLLIAGDRYADALAESDAWVARSGALPIHAYEQLETLLGQGTVGLELERQAPAIDTLLVAVGGGGLIGGIAAWYAGPVRIVGVEPEAAPTLARAGRRPAGGRGSRRHRGRLTRAAAGRKPDVSARPAACGAGRAGERRFHPRRTGRALDLGSRGQRARRRRGAGRAALGPVPAGS